MLDAYAYMIQVPASAKVKGLRRDREVVEEQACFEHGYDRCRICSNRRVNLMHRGAKPESN